jgi:nitroimidazol reductase NimA-like FMN-containing flavoprotein (pyridoxamine 5'-phosphate oxidase superfamily)
MASAEYVSRFRVLTREECKCLLARNHVGRIAFARGNRIEIIPLHYVFADGVLCGRTARDTRLERTSRNFSNAWPAAFEVDEVDGLFEWRSVVVHGNLHAAVVGGQEWRRDEPEWEKAVQAFRSLVPGSFTDSDPTAFRDVLIRVDVAEISGREALSAPRASKVLLATGQGGAGSVRHDPLRLDIARVRPPAAPPRSAR